MQKLKLTSIIIAIIATFASCKKDTLKTEELKDAITKNMSMNYHGEQLQYSVKFSRTSEKVIVEGKDAARVKEIVNTNKNAFAYFKSETEIEMYNNVNDYYIRNNMVNNGNRVGVTSTTNSTTRLFLAAPMMQSASKAFVQQDRAAAGTQPIATQKHTTLTHAATCLKPQCSKCDRISATALY